MLSRGYDLNLFGGLPRIRLLEPGRIARPDLLTLARAQITGVDSSTLGRTAPPPSYIAADVARFAPGLVIEGQRTNVLANTETLSTQSVSVTATAYTLSFWGTGSVTLSGAATGATAGTGAGNRVTRTFTPSAGTLTLTVSGSVQYAQLEQGAFASTYIHATAASTRGADLVTATPASLGIGGNGACTVLWSGVLPQAAPSGSNQILFTIDDGGTNNRISIINSAGGASVVPVRYAAGAYADAGTIGSLVAGAAFAVGWSANGAGGVASSLNGAAVGTLTGAPSSGLTTFRVGTNAAGVGNLFGDTYYLDIIPRAVSDATLQRLVAAMPLS